jgi:hypothetical protein
MKVYIVQECYASEGSDVIKVFKSLDNAIEFVKQKYLEFPKMQIFVPPYDLGFDVKTIRFERSDKEDYYRFVDIEEWEIKE